MATVTFDTLKFVKTLKEAGVPEPQAEAFSTAVRESHEAADLATKGDIVELRHEINDLRKDMDTKLEASTALLRHEIQESASALRQEMSGMKFELLKWIIGLAIAQAGFLIGILKFLP